MAEIATTKLDTIRRIGLATGILGSQRGTFLHSPGDAIVDEIDRLIFIQNHPAPSVAAVRPALTLEIAERLKQREGSSETALAAMLVQPAFDWPDHLALSDIPDWLLKTHTRWRLASPPMFLRPGDAQAYETYIVATIGEYYDAVNGITFRPQAIALAGYFAEYLSLTQLYFNDGHHADTMRKRAALYEIQCLCNGLPLAHVFAAKRDASKVTIGVILESTGANAETYYAVSHLEHFPRDRARIILFHQDDIPIPVKSVLFSLADETVSLPRSDLKAVAAIRAHDLDVMLILSNVTSILNSTTLYSLFRLARLQVATTASPLTTGLTNVDVYLGGALSEPPGDPSLRYTEHFAAIPGSVNHYAYQYDRDAQTIVIDRAMLGIPDDAVLFVSSSNCFKITPELIASWGRILASVPDSRLLIMPFGAQWGQFFVPEFLDRIKVDFSEYDISPDRIHVIQDRLPSRADLTAVLRLGNIYLDSYPFAGACSLICPLQAGLPIVEREGPTFRSRLGSTMLHMAGLQSMITEDETSYEAAAIALGLDSGLRARARRQVADVIARGLPFFDSRRFSVEIETTLLNLHETRQACLNELENEPPQNLMQAITELSCRLAFERIPLYAALAGPDLWRLLIRPYFEQVDTGDLRLLEIGSNTGALATQFLQAGWQADMVEPDPAHYVALGMLAVKYPGRAHHHETYAAQGDYHLVIIGKGQDQGALLDRFDLTGTPPFLVVLLEAPRPDNIGQHISQMREQGYEAMVIGNTGSPVAWNPALHWPASVGFGEQWQHSQDVLAGTIVYFRTGDTRLLAAMLDLLDSFLPGRDRQWHRSAQSGRTQ